MKRELRGARKDHNLRDIWLFRYTDHVRAARSIAVT